MLNTGYVFTRRIGWDYPLIVRGKGVYVYDADGKEYIDSCSGACAANLGHGNEEIMEVIAKQGKDIAFQHMFWMMTEPCIKLAGTIQEMMPGDLNYTFFADNGSTATESAIKMARQYFQERDGASNKFKIIGRWRAYHGNTIGALSASGIPGLRRKFSPLLLDFPHITPAYCYRCELGKCPDSCNCECADALEREIRRQGPENVAGFIYEPVTGSSASGAWPKKQYFEKVRAICDKYDVLMIADEVMNGFGRTGRNFAMCHFDVVPDIICFAKGVTGAYIPLGGITVRDHIYRAFADKTPPANFSHGHTYTGLAIACAAANKVLEILQRDSLIENSAKMGGIYMEKLRRTIGDNPIVGDIRGLGLQMGIEFVKDKKTREPFPVTRGLTTKLVKYGYKNGISFYPGNGTYDEVNGDVVTLSAPLIVNAAQVDELVEKIRLSIDDLCGELL